MIERRRLSVAVVEPESDSDGGAAAASAKPLSAKPLSVWVRLNRNLLNYPLARDVRTTVQWRNSPKTGRWLAALPQEQRVLVILPADTPACERRLRPASTSTCCSRCWPKWAAPSSAS